jgi:putative tryptophan/tyrosine transport system substrate-binding protein
MKKKITVFILSAWFLALCLSAHAQQPKKVPRIGFLAGVSASTISARTDAFRQGLRELGYIEGKNIIVEWRYADEKLERLNDLATELVRLKLDVLVSSAPTVTRPLRTATKTIPIVMAFDDDPVGNGFITSLAQPGGNITGLSNLAPEISGKQLELLREIVPKLGRVAVLGTSTRPGNAQSLKEIELAAGSLRSKGSIHRRARFKGNEAAFRGASKGRAAAVLVFGGPVFNSRRKQLADLAVRNRLAAIYPRQEFVEEGGLMMYGPNVTDLYRRAATYVDKILKGAKPADLPVEQPTKFEFVINLKTAKQIDLTITPNVLARADKVIK